MQHPDALVERFRALGLRVTPQRRGVFEVLHDGLDHPSVEALHEAVLGRVPGVALKTVYEAVHDLADLGEVTLVDVGLGRVLVDIHGGTPHHHTVCDRCAQVRDVPADSLAADAVRLPDFEVGRVDVVFRGLCDACRDRPPVGAQGRRRA